MTSRTVKESRNSPGARGASRTERATERTVLLLTRTASPTTGARWHRASCTRIHRRRSCSSSTTSSRPRTTVPISARCSTTNSPDLIDHGVMPRRRRPLQRLRPARQTPVTSRFSPSSTSAVTASGRKSRAARLRRRRVRGRARAGCRRPRARGLAAPPQVCNRAHPVSISAPAELRASNRSRAWPSRVDRPASRDAEWPEG
jgi:hypothetical protein